MDLAGQERMEGDNMPRTSTKSPKKSNTRANAKVAERPPEAAATADVLTLAEAAAYLRCPEAEVVRLIHSQGLLGRAVGGEWRFLKTALQDWWRTPLPRPSKEAMRSTIGSWKDDPYLEEMLKEIYRKRGRPMTEDGE
jgi:excisionase family DNA binding protein